MDIKLREEQINILRYKQGKLAIPAVPGAGKTFVLSHLAAKLIQEELADGEKLLILTYMNSAVQNFRERIEDILPPGDFDNYFEVMTIHKFASEVIKNNLEHLNIQGDYTLIETPNRSYIMNSVVNKWRYENGERFQFFIGEVSKGGTKYKAWHDELVKLSLNLISKCKNYSISPANLLSKTKNFSRDSILKIVAELYSSYQISCNKEAYLDYDDLLALAYKLLKENKKVRDEVSKKYRYVFEDEAQDSNYLQNKILSLMSEENLVKVGDINQSILASFTSSSPELFKKFCAGPVYRIEMFTAGRSSQDIIDFANYFVQFNRKKHPIIEARKALENQLIKPVPNGGLPKNPKPDFYGIKTYICRSEDEEFSTLCSFMKKYMKNYPEKTAAVLLPQNYQVEKAFRLLKKSGVDCEVLSDLPSSITDVMEFLSAVLDYLARPFDNRKFIELVNLSIPEEKLCDEDEFFPFLKGIALEKLFFRKQDLNIPEKFKVSNYWEDFLSLVKKLRALLEYPQNSLERLVLFIAEVFSFQGEALIFSNKVSEDLKRIIRLNPKWTIRDVANDLKKNRNNQFSYLAKAVQLESGSKVSQSKNLVLSTYHKSKGMEWDLVYLFGVNSHSFPAYLGDNEYGKQDYLKKEFQYPQSYANYEFKKLFIKKEFENHVNSAKIEKICEGIRLLYVGITRAKEALVISGSKDKELFYLKEFKKYIENRGKGD